MFTERALFCPEFAASEKAQMNWYMNMLKTDTRQHVSTQRYGSLIELQEATRQHSMDDGGSTTNLLSPNKGMGVETGVGIDNSSSQLVHGMDHTTTPNEETTSQIPNENESVREKNNKTDEDEPSGCDVDFVPPLIGPDTKYDENKMREPIANWILSTEQPFATVEDVMFVKMMKTATPLFEKVSRVTITSECFKVYEHEKKRLKALTKAASKISLTTDCWKSSHQKIEYMVITAHFVDHNWRLQKRVLSFVHVPPPRNAVDIADGYNDKALRRLKETFSRVRKLSCGGRLFHIRCCAHILNLLVKDGLAIIDHIIGDVREGIKYINNSEGRRLNFSKAAHQMQIRDRKLMLDVPTRWNSTYDMLCMALKFKDAFLRYAEYEPHFHHLPTDKDWENVQSVCEILKVFKVCTNIISGSDYPTANLYLIEVFRVKQTLDKGSLSTTDFIRDMVKKMKEKFDKYWGECHLAMAIASVLDPRFKMKLVEFCFPTLYQNSDENIKEVKNALYEMYSEYLEMHDTLVRESATHGSEHERNVLGLNEGTSLGSGWEAFGEFITTADLE
ncbi:zinc finger BED domain-containing protein RICESLEEPER 2-like [Lactuca sativa]|uniref:zinc finger BED domain-containing protein RICESLEEPER 2-like n=1 Tax=Lactuca sativa TaxID=4236 RepID=UPI0022B04182|nr:zinc finger BED domain-containing protein RICESLEEPER 2-like [Lactuca sativa]